MKAGLRTPSPQKMVKAKTTGRFKRAAKKAVNPIYGKKGVGYMKDPEKAVKNMVYHKLTVDPLDPLKHQENPDLSLDLEPIRAPNSSALVNFISIIGITSLICFLYKLLTKFEFSLLWFILGIGCVITAVVITRRNQ